MATTGYILPSASAQASTGQTWNNTAYAEADDTNAAAAQGSGTCYAFWYSFDFATAGLASGNTINDVEIRIRGYDAFGDGGWAFGMKWATNGTNVVANYTGTESRVPASGDFGGTSGTPVTSTVSLSGTLPTADELLSANFRIMLYHASGHDSLTEDGRIEAIWMNVDYTAGGGGISIPVVMRHRMNMGS